MGGILLVDGPYISIHAPRTGRDEKQGSPVPHYGKFQSTRPVRGATKNRGLQFPIPVNFNPRAPYGARRRGVRNIVDRASISIHAPRTGRDAHLHTDSTGVIAISIHAPRTGRDICGGKSMSKYIIFQSTRPVRGATVGKFLIEFRDSLFQSTRPVRGATMNTYQLFWVTIKISIHAPRTGRDASVSSTSKIRKGISIHAPRTGRDATLSGLCEGYCISIHAPRTGRDPSEFVTPRGEQYFNPRAPYGARQGMYWQYWLHV